MDDYLDYYDDFEQDIGSGDTSKKQSAKIESTPIHKETKKNKRVKKTVAGGNSPKDRLLSSKEHELRQVHNKLTETIRQLNEIQKENKTLRRLQIRQEKELTRISGQEGELPSILQKHSSEVKSLRYQLRQSQLNNSELQKKQSELSEELWKVNERKKKLEKLCKRRDLLEREHLLMELQETNETLKEKDRKLQELEKSIELINKNHGHEVKTLLNKYKQLQNQFSSARQDMIQYRKQLKEKERLLDVTNIYSQRVPHSSSLLLPMAEMDDAYTQTVLTYSPKKGEAMFVSKYKTSTAECQTESSWEMFSPKRNATSTAAEESSHTSKPNEMKTTGFIQPGLPCQPIVHVSQSTVHHAPQPVPYTLQPVMHTPQPTVHAPQPVVHAPQLTVHAPQPIIHTPPQPTVHSPLQQSTPVTPNNAKSTFITDDEPIMQLTPPQTTVITQPTPVLSAPPTGQPSVSLNQPTRPSPTPVVQPTAVVGPRKGNIQEILFGNNKKDHIASQDETTPITTITASESVKGSFGAKEKDELMKKLFPEKFKPPPQTTTEPNPVKIINSIDGLVDNSTQKHANKYTTTSASQSSDDNQQHRLLFGSSTALTERKRNDTSTIGTGNNGDFMAGRRQRNHDQTNNSDFLSQLFDGGTGSNGGVGRGLSSGYHPHPEEQLVEKSSSTSTTSVLSRSERIKNMHQGLPSMASDNDPYGAKQRRSINHGSLSKETSDTATRGAEAAVKFGRRAGGNSDKSSTISNGLIFGESTSTQKTRTLFGNNTAATADTTSGSIINNNPSFGGVSNESTNGYSWETKVDLHHSNTTASNISKNNSSKGFQLDDDLEELTIT